MKKQTIFSILIAATLILITSCNSKPSADNYLQDETQRKEIISAIVHHQPYMIEMVHEMMDNDSCKQVMMDNMMMDPSMKEMHMNMMMNMCKDDSSMCKMMMGKTMEMCEADSTKCKMMKSSMQSHSNVMRSMKGMCHMDSLKK
jgi:hypothetical protein